MLPEAVEGQLQIQHRNLAFALAPGAPRAVITDPSTAADLLDVRGRDAEPDGIVRLDGTDLGTVTLAEVRRAVLVARHDAALFEGTLADKLLTDGSSDEAALARPWPRRRGRKTAGHEVDDPLADATVGDRAKRRVAEARQNLLLQGGLMPGPGCCSKIMSGG